MFTVTRVQTYDGRLHNDANAALHYLKEQEGHQICTIARKIVEGEGKYSKAVALLENRDTEPHLRALLRIRDDMKLEKQEEE